jgi:hypothetical protein
MICKKGSAKVDQNRQNRLERNYADPVEYSGIAPVPDSSEIKRIRKLLRYNKELEKQADLTQLNENFLELKLEELESILSASDSIEKFTLARLTELALICAANYAKNGCIAEVGDLFFNPRLILIHIKGESGPVIKERHTPLTVQFGSRGLSRAEVVNWLRHNTMIETVKEPILPVLLNLLETNGCSDAYLESVRERMSMVTSVTTQWPVSAAQKKMDGSDGIASILKNGRKSLEKYFHGLDKTAFDDLGEKIFSMYTQM